MRDEAIPRIKAIGQYLRTTRQERGEDLYDIADFLRIRPSYLFALEEGDLDAMPGRPYAFGFLRSYADYLGFDGTAVVAEVKSLLEGTPPVRVKQPPRQPVESSRPAWSLATACIILIVAALGGWKVLQGGENGMLTRLASLPGEIGAYLSNVVDENREVAGVIEPDDVQTASGDAPERPSSGSGTSGEPVAVAGREPVTSEAAGGGVADAGNRPEGVPDNNAPGDVPAEGTDVAALPDSATPDSATVADDAGTTPVVVRQIDMTPAAQEAGDAGSDPSGTLAAAGLPEKLEAEVPQVLAAVEPLPDMLLADAARTQARLTPLESPDPTTASATEIGGETASELLGSLRSAASETEPRVFGEGLDSARVVLVARESSWIQIKSSERDYIRSRTLEPGDRFALPNRSDLALWTGNAGGLEVVVDGRNLGRLGGRGAVMRDVALSPEILLANLR
ncbi:MAG: helix-turn-helix domain-containing protein [Geminicoccaceae bacterium]|nr:helix-turn-helix domain-containing protein [Geminicoccaceae bacterium]